MILYMIILVLETMFEIIDKTFYAEINSRSDRTNIITTSNFLSFLEKERKMFDALAILFKEI